MQSNEFLDRFHSANHWQHLNLGELWLTAAKAFMPEYPSAASKALEWSNHYFLEYNRAWTAGLPASRWDSDGSECLMEVSRLRKSLPEHHVDPALPNWAAQLLAGDCTNAVKEAPATPTPPFDALVPLLKQCAPA